MIYDRKSGAYDIGVIMKLIYLDTSNLALLTRIKEKESDRFQKFCDKWKKKKLILAISKAHLFEIVRHGSEEEIEARYRLLESLLPIRVEMKVQNKEIVSALIKKEIFRFTYEGSELKPEFFGEYVETNDDFQRFRVFSSGLIRSLFDLTYEAHAASWRARESDVQRTTKKVRRLRDLRGLTTPMNDEMKLQEVMDQVAANLENISGIPEEFQNIGLDFVKQHIENFESKAHEVGYLEAFADFVDIDPHDAKTQGAPVDSLLVDFGFRLSVRRVVSEMTEDESVASSLATKLSIQDCEGMWLSKEVETQIRKNGDFSTSNELDLEHISHLPYVDLLIADKRIVAMTKQVIKAAGDPNPFERINPPVAIPNTMEALETAVFN